MKHSPRWGLKSTINVLFVAVTFGLLIGWLIAPDYVHARRSAAIGYFQTVPPPVAESRPESTAAEEMTRSARLQLGEGFELSKISAEVDSLGIHK